MFFFFQAEDGIRDIGVTGVQTCALPILGERLLERLLDVVHVICYPGEDVAALAGVEVVQRQPRSEERRVGKECRSRWAAYHLKKKIKLYTYKSNMLHIVTDRLQDLL